MGGMSQRAVSFEVFGGAPESATGPERLPVLFCDADERREVLPGPLLPDIARRVQIAARDNPATQALLGDGTFTRACAEVIRALITGYTLWIDPYADQAPAGVENLVQIEFRRPGADDPRPAPIAGRSILSDDEASAFQRRHGIIYSPHLHHPPSGALCWTSSSLVARDGGIVTIYAYVVAPPIPETLRADDFPILTGQEADALFRSVADGRTARYWTIDAVRGEIAFAAPGVRHAIRLALTPEERAAGTELAALQELLAAQDADACMALMFVTRLLAPPGSASHGSPAEGWVHLDDVASRIWPAPRSREERRQQRARVYGYLLFAARAIVEGRRTGRYVDRSTGEGIDTQIAGPVWTLPEAGGLAVDNPPVRVRVELSPAWARSTSHPNLAQYLPLGELLGAIPGNKASGAWARVIGMALAGFWRRHPREALDGSLQPTRRELLARYTPKTAPPLDVLSGNDPLRAVEYWRGALQMLVEAGLLSADGEAALGRDEMRQALRRYEWQEPWLDARVPLAPGPRMAAAIRALVAPPRARRGARSADSQ